jgi:hypothetical protein
VGAEAVNVTCCNPDCRKQGGSSTQSEQCAHSQVQQQQQQQQVEAVEAAAGSHQEGQGEAAEGQQGAEEGPCVVRQGLFGLPGNPALQLQLVLPPDLLKTFGELEQLSKVGAVWVCC